MQRWEIVLPSARHLKERLSVSQSVSQSGKQSVRQSVGQAGRQTGRQKHTVWLFALTDYRYKQWGTIGQQEHSVVEWQNTRPMTGLTPLRIPASSSAIASTADRLMSLV